VRRIPDRPAVGGCRSAAKIFAGHCIPRTGGLFARGSGLTASAGVPGARGQANQRRA
jgi:hypothetical protein